jgi:hypothetical protein
MRRKTLEFTGGWRLEGDQWVSPEGERLRPIGGGTGIEIAALAVAAVGMAVSAYGAYSASEAQQTQLKNESKMRESEAAMAQQAGQDAAARQRKKDSYSLNSFAAKAAAAGVVARSGSSLLDELDYSTQSEMEAQHAQYGYNVTSATKLTQSSFAKWQAGRIDPSMEAGKSLISSAASIAGSYGTGGYGVAGSQKGGGLSARPAAGGEA